MLLTKKYLNYTRHKVERKSDLVISGMNMYEYQVIPTNKTVDLCTNLIPREHSNKLNGMFLFFFFNAKGYLEISYI